MATRSPEGRHGSPADGEHVEVAPSAEAELKILMFPVTKDDDEDVPKRNWLVSLLRRAGLTFHARMTVPPADADELLATVRKVGLAATWALTVVVTLAITLAYHVPVTAVITIVVIELIGFVVGALSLRRRRNT